MNSVNNIHLRIRPFVCALFAVVVLALGASVALAQGTPPNMDFHDYLSGNTRYNSTAGAFLGRVTGYVHGHIRSGRLTRLSIGLDPDFDGPNGLKKQLVYFDVDSPSHSAYAPLAQWYNVSSTTKRLVISNVRATQEFNGTSTYSLGVARVEITFVNGAPGRLVVSYTHRSYERLYGTPTLPNGVRAFNGTVFSGSPVDGHRLYYDLR